MSLRVFGLLVLAAGAFVLALSLGNWQTRRAAQKLEIEAQWEAANRAAPLELSARSLPPIESLPMRVKLAGTFEHGKSVWLENRQHEARPGFWVLTPLRHADGTVVLVNRGWVPRDPADRARRPPVAEPAGPVTVEGLALPHAPRLLDLGEARDGGPLPALWQNLDYARYESVSGLSVARLVVQQTGSTRSAADAPLADEGLVRAWARPASGVEKHRGYAFQWYALAALIALLTVFFSWRHLRGRALRSSPGSSS